MSVNESIDELEAGELSVEFEGEEPEAVLEWAIERFAPRIALSTAFQIEEADVPVQALVNPLRGVAADSAYVASAIRQIPGRVLAVGHSYGGAVITNAASLAENVVGLVYVAAFAPDEGETLMDIEGQSGTACSPVR